MMNNLGDLDPLDYFPGEDELENYSWLEEPLLMEDLTVCQGYQDYSQDSFIQDFAEKYVGSEEW